MPDLPVVEKSGAFILRRNHDGRDDLLLFRHADFPEAGVQIPGGTVEIGSETAEAAVHREVMEEAGLCNLEMIRKAGVLDWVWPEKQVLVKGHLYVLRAAASTPDTWTHAVGGTGEDAQLRFAYFWLRPSAEFRLGARIDPFLNEKYLPELYGKDGGNR
jgi:ADP-ribose pyrophosphatase YjhB (NUDIX family)